jgi:hypothetical protein
VILASDGQLAGNLRFNLPQATVLTTEPPTGMPPVSFKPFQRIVFVWRKRDGSAPVDFDEEFADYLRQQGLPTQQPPLAIVSYPYAWGKVGDQYLFGIATLDLPR